MKCLVIHKYLPGQFEYLIRAILDNPNNEVLGIGQSFTPQLHTLFGLDIEIYYPVALVDHPLHDCLFSHAENMANALAVASILARLKNEGYVPDICFAHIGWGEVLYFKDIYPNVPLVGYCEFYYHALGVDADFDPNFPLTQNDIYKIRSANSTLLLSLTSIDIGISPTHWQKSLFPKEFQHKIKVIHEGLDLSELKPNSEAVFHIPDLIKLTSNDKVVTYATRNLEPYRGFHIFMRAIKGIFENQPDCKIVIAGGDDVSYSKPIRQGTYREKLSNELAIDNNRVHFVGRLPRSEYLKLLQITSAHIYLTIPFVLSWSMLEAMATGCPIVASDTPPVKEFIQHERNGLLVNFFSPEQITHSVIQLLNDSKLRRELGQKARHDVAHQVNNKAALRQYFSLINRLLHGDYIK
jgi:glycosyltransferase involved in cell wall biosynthesis